MQAPRILVCVNRRLGPAQASCGDRGGESLIPLIEAEVSARGLGIPVERFICFGACAMGANVRLAPGGRFFHQATASDVPGIVAAAAEFAAALRGSDT